MTPAPALLLLAAGFLGWGDLYVYGMYSPASLRLLTIGVVVLAVGAVAGRARRGIRTDRLATSTVAVLVVWQAIGVARVVTYYGTGRAQFYARLLAVALPTVGLAVAVGTTAVRDRAWWALLALFGLGAVAAIHASPRPAIDVWYLIQHATDCVLHGCNPYTMRTPSSPGVQDSFNYLPMTAVLLAPVRAVVGDTRYGDAAAMLVAAVLLRRMAAGEGRRIAALVLCVPGLFFAVEQAWTESLLVALLIGAVWARRPVVTGILLGLALATKQHVWLLVPAAAMTLGLRSTLVAVGTGAVAMLPWFLADPGAMWHGTVRFLQQLPARVDSSSVWLHEPAGWRTPLVLLALVTAYCIVWGVCRGTRQRFLLASALVLAAFDLTNKQTFFNQWLLVTWLAVAAVAVESGRRVSIVSREVPPLYAGRVTDRAGARGGVRDPD